MVDNSGIEVSKRNQYVHVTHAHTFQIGIVCIHFAWSASYNSMPLSQNTIECGARYADRESVEEMMRGQKVHSDIWSVSVKLLTNGEWNGVPQQLFFPSLLALHAHVHRQICETRQYTVHR